MKDIIEREERLNEKERRNFGILNAIRKNKRISRAEISRETDLNIVTVSNYIARFVKDKIVLETGLDESTGGRRAELLRLNAGYCYSIGIDLGAMHLALDAPVVVALIDLNGNIVASERAKKEKEPFESLASRAMEMTDALLVRAGIDRLKINGIGVGIWGVLDPFRGTARYAVEQGETANYTGFAARLKEKFGVPILVEHDANLACLGEKWSAGGPISKAENMIFLCSDSSCGFIINGELYYGATKSAGELNIKPPKTGAETKDEGLLRCWETYKYGCCLRSRGIDLGIPLAAKKKNLAETVEAADAGDETAKKAIEEAGEYLGTKIAFLINLFNPEITVIGRGIEKAGEMFFASVRKAVHDWAYEESAKVVKILPAALGENSVAVGAGALVMQRFFAKV